MSALFSERELSQYSVTRALSALIRSKKPDGLEGEVEKALLDQFRQQSSMEPKGFLLPISCLKTLNATSLGSLTAENPASIVPALRNRATVIKLGATVLDSLTGNVPIPRETSQAQAQWLAEYQPVTQGTDPGFGATELKPHRCASILNMSSELLKQSSLGVENFVRSSLLSVVGLALDQAALIGTGGVQPLGIANTEGVSTVTFGGAATRSKVVDFQGQVAGANGTMAGSLAYVTSPSAAAKWMITPEAANYPTWLWAGNIDSGTVVGARAESTKQITDDRVVFGAWPHLVIGIWGDALDVLTDPYTYDYAGLVRFIPTLFADVGLAHPKSFCVSTDSGAQ